MGRLHATDKAPDVPTLEQLLQLIRADRQLTYNNRRRMTSAVSGLIKHAGVNPRTTRATFRACREPLNAIEPVAARISHRYHVIIRTYLRLAFVRYAGGYDAKSRPMSPSWARLKRLLTADGPYRRLIRFIRWCSATGISPNRVDDGVSARYLDHLQAETTVRRPRVIHRRTCKTWNEMAETHRRWPQVRLTVPHYRKYVALPLDRFPQSFRQDLDVWKTQLASTALVVPNGPRKPLGPVTVTNMAQKVLRFASVMVREGTPLSELTDLAALLRPDRFRSVFERFWLQNGQKSTRAQYETARIMKYLARHRGRVDPAVMLELDQITRRLHTSPIGLTPKNRDVLRQFDDGANVRRLVTLPGKLAAQARRAEERGAIRKAALLMQIAVAIELRLVAPIRFQNLLLLQLGVHFRSVAHDGRRAVYLSIPGSEVKNKLPLEFELPQETIDLLAAYVRWYLPVLTEGQNGMLFPGADHGHKSYGALAQQVKAAIRRYAGLHVSMHAFRHIAAKLYLAQHPQDYLPVSLLLGHLSVQTTMKFYCELERPAVARQYAHEVLSRSFPSQPMVFPPSSARERLVLASVRGVRRT